MNKIFNQVVNAKNLVSPGVVHGFFGRHGGGSEGKYSSLNCSNYVGDDEDRVKKNLEIVKNTVNASKIITLHQIHSNICIEVTKNTSDSIDGDAFVTAEKDIALGILTADCAPILFCDFKENIIGAAHAGWRGAVSGIIESTINKMISIGSNPINIKAAIGPCIGKNSYEIGDDFKKSFTGEGDCFLLMDMKLHFDLPKYCQKRMLECRLREDNIEILDIDTFAKNNDYFSYRYSGKFSDGICGRNISVICLTP
jgi:YfiH family protein